MTISEIVLLLLEAAPNLIVLLTSVGGAIAYMYRRNQRMLAAKDAAKDRLVVSLTKQLEALTQAVNLSCDLEGDSNQKHLENLAADNVKLRQLLNKEEIELKRAKKKVEELLSETRELKTEIDWLALAAKSLYYSVNSGMTEEEAEHIINSPHIQWAINKPSLLADSLKEPPRKL